jgi:hypothetical protein
VSKDNCIGNSTAMNHNTGGCSTNRRRTARPSPISTAFWRGLPPFGSKPNNFRKSLAPGPRMMRAASVLAAEYRVPYSEMQRRLGWLDDRAYFALHPEQKTWSTKQRLEYMNSEARRNRRPATPSAACRRDALATLAAPRSRPTTTLAHSVGFPSSPSARL